MEHNNESDHGYLDDSEGDESLKFGEMPAMGAPRSRISHTSSIRSGKRSRDESAIEIALLNKHHNIVEMLLRDVSLKNAVRGDRDSDYDTSNSPIVGQNQKRYSNMTDKSNHDKNGGLNDVPITIKGEQDEF